MMPRRKHLILKRDKPEPERTFGTLFWGSSFMAHTLEPGDDDIDAPRVPPGDYELVPHGWEADSPVRYNQTYALVGETVSHQPGQGKPRSAILIHAGNRDDDTRGCILVGLDRGTVHGEPAVVESRAAMSKLRQALGERRARLTIMGE